MTYLYLKHDSNALTNIALNIEHKTWEKTFMYRLQGVKLTREINLSLPDSVAVVLGILKPKPQTRAVVGLDKQGQVKESRTRPGTRISLPMKK